MTENVDKTGLLGYYLRELLCLAEGGPEKGSEKWARLLKH